MELKFYQGLARLQEFGFVYTRYNYKDQRPSFVCNDIEVSLNMKRIDGVKTIKALHKNKKVKRKPNDYLKKPEYEIYVYSYGVKRVLDIDYEYSKISKRKKKSIVAKLEAIVDNMIKNKNLFGIKIEE